MEPIHIFLDTTLTYDDPFFKKNYNSQLLRIAQIYNFPIYMSKVVFEETRNKFENNVNDRIGGLDKALLELENFYPSKLNSVEINCSFNDFLREFDQFYSDLIARKVIHLIEYDNSILPVLVERSIRRIKPFSKKKQEFRDAITWLSYAKFAEENNLNNCFFITRNVSDFCNENTKNTIHPDLLADSTRFIHYVSSYDLFESEIKITPYMMSADITEWLSKNTINSDFILDKFQMIFLRKMKDFFFNYDSDYLVNVSLPRNMWINIDSVEFDGINEEITTTVIKDQVIIQGDLFLIIEVSLHVFNDFDDEHTIGTDIAQIVSAYTFTMDINKIYEETLEFSDIDITKSADFRYIFEDYER